MLWCKSLQMLIHYPKRINWYDHINLVICSNEWHHTAVCERGRKTDTSRKFTCSGRTLYDRSDRSPSHFQWLHPRNPLHLPLCILHVLSFVILAVSQLLSIQIIPNVKTIYINLNPDLKSNGISVASKNYEFQPWEQQSCLRAIFQAQDPV